MAAPRPVQGIPILSLATLLWGTTFIVTKQTLPDVSASMLVFVRFLVAGIVFLPFLRPGRQLWIAGTELGIWLWLGFATQTIGLRHTTVDRSAFITALNVIFVPAIGAVAGRSTRTVIWIAAILAFLGVAFLSNDGSTPNLGDLWSLACALCFAFYIFRLETFATRFASKPLTAVQLWIVVILSFAWTVTTHELHSPIPWKAALYLGLVATAATTWFQTVGQKNVTAAQAAVLYTLEPVWAVFFAWIILHQALGLVGWLGAILIVLAAVLTQIPPAAFNRNRVIVQ